jgi:hypothetical protein
LKKRSRHRGPIYSPLLAHLRPRPKPSWASSWLFISFTRLVIDKWKDKRRGWQKGELLLEWNLYWFIFELCLGALLLAMTVRAGTVEAPSLLWVPIGVLAFWRINEIVYAFCGDIADTVMKVKSDSGLDHLNRLKMLARSTVGLVVWFATLYSALGAGDAFKCPPADFRDTLYFSAVTLFSIGQEGQEVQNHAVRIVQVYQGISGFVLLAVAVAVYVGRPSRSDA